LLNPALIFQRRCGILTPLVFINLTCRRTRLSDSRTTVSHDGVVVDADNGRVRVRITSHSACAACHARSMCPGADTKEKIIDAETGESLHAGDAVTVIMRERTGWLAVVVAFLGPFVLLLLVLLTVHALTADPVTAGLAALASMVPYFLVVYMLRARLARHIRFTAVSRLKS